MKLTPQITIIRSVDAVCIYGPFNKANHSIYKVRNGKFDPERVLNCDKAWKFAPTAAVESMIDELFGRESPLVRALLDESDICDHERTWTIGGYLVASSKGRDKGAEIATGVQLEAGQWLPSGGSVKYPVIRAEDISLSLVVRRNFAERYGLKIVAEDDGAPTNDQPAPVGHLAAVPDADLLAECTRRGLALAR